MLWFGCVVLGSQGVNDGEEETDGDVEQDDGKRARAEVNIRSLLYIHLIRVYELKTNNF